MNRKKLLTITAILMLFVVGIVVYLVGFSGRSTIIPNAQSNPTNTSSTPSATPSPSAESTEKDKATDEGAKKILTVDEKKIDGIEGFSNVELKEATEFVTSYAYATHENQYLLNGDWAKDGAKVDKFTPFMNAYYSKDIIDEMKKFEGKQGTPEFSEKFTSIAPFFDDTDAYRPSEACNEGFKLDDKGNPIETQEEAKYNFNCVDDLKISEISWTSNKEGQGYFLRADFKVTSKVALYSKELNAEAYTNADYKYSLRLEKNILEDGKSEWEITGYDITPTFSNIKPRAEEGNNE